MAERYGTIPKIFTKEWWPYFWMYYKWHTIAVVAVVGAIVMTAVQMSQNKISDFTINYIGIRNSDENTELKLQEEIEKLISDIDENGETNADIRYVAIGTGEVMSEVEYAMVMKHDVELTDKNSYLYLYEEAPAKMLLGREGSEDVYVNVEEWYGGNIDEVITYKSVSGKPIALSVEGNQFLENMGIDTKGLYLALKAEYSKEEINTKSYKEALGVVDAILK